MHTPAAAVCEVLHLDAHTYAYACVKLDPAAESRAGNPTPRLQQKAFVALTLPCPSFLTPLLVSKS